MLVYALGRGLQPYDRPTVTSILSEVEKNNYRFSSLILGVVRSLPFQMRSAPPKLIDRADSTIWVRAK